METQPQSLVAFGISVVITIAIAVGFGHLSQPSHITQDPPHMAGNLGGPD